MEDGGIFWRLPIHAFCHKEDIPAVELDELMLWDSFSNYISVTVFDLLRNRKMKYTSRRKEKYEGIYLFTLDWGHEDANMADVGFSEAAGQHKCGHVIKLDNGNYAAQPNNRLLCHDPSFCTKPGQMVVERKLHEHKWSVEQNWKWVLEDNSNYDYNITPRDDNEYKK
jgi:hypothetical protein|tara:strand:- start:2144 stop:2647 length:504 start_codon:yes stop_codon:yes gene_type:complete